MWRLASVALPQVRSPPSRANKTTALFRALLGHTTFPVPSITQSSERAAASVER